MARIKEVHEAEQVAHLWAHAGQERARNASKNIFFEGDTIYSYGHHFPMGRRVPIKLSWQSAQGKASTDRNVTAFLLNSASYSSTTNRHQGYVRQAVFGDYVFIVPNINAGTREAHKTNLEWMDTNIEGAAIAFTRVRVRAESAFNSLEKSVGNRNLYARTFKCGKPIEVPKIARDALPARLEISAESAKREEYRRVNASALEKERERTRVEFYERLAKDAPSLQQAWRDGATVESLTTTYPQEWRYTVGELLRGASRGYGGVNMLIWTLLRIKPCHPDTVETSQGAEFPAVHGKRAYRTLKPIRARGDTWQRNGHTIHCGGFDVDRMDAQGNVYAGCHVLRWEEIELLAKRCGWDKDASKVQEHFQHDVCPKCSAPSNPAERVADQSLRICSNTSCDHVWVEDLDTAPTVARKE